MPSSIYSLFDELAGAVQVETLLIKRLTTFLDAERELLVKGKHAAFVQALDEKKGLHREYLSAARTRDNAILAICEALDLDKDTVQLCHLAKELLAQEPDRAQRTVSIIEDYREAANQLARSGTRTQQLLNRGVEFTDQMVRMIASAGQPPPTYSFKGRLDRPSPESRVGLSKDL